jgi:iron complex outermembrane receptor protein
MYAMLLLGIILCTSIGRAESGLSSIAGTVTGPDNARLPGAVVTAQLIGTQNKMEAVSNSYGMYRLPDMPEGEYKVTARLQGFQGPAGENLKLAAGASRNLDLQMQLASVNTIVTVIGLSPKDSMEAAETRESSARDVGEALDHVPGVFSLRKGGIANDIVLRGFASKDLNVLIDGQRVYGACPNHMDPPAFHIDFSEVDRIEVAKGAFDIKNQGSLGGVINIVTQKATPGFHVTGNLSTGSYGLVNPSASMSYGSKKFSILAGYSYRLSSPYTDGSGKRFTESLNFKPSELEGDAFRAGTVWTSLSVSPQQGHLLQLSYTHQEADHVLYPYLQMDAIYDDTDRFNGGYQINNIAGFLRSFRVQAYFAQVNHWMTDQYRTSSLNLAREYSMGTQARTKVLGGKIETMLKTVTVGVEAFHREWDGSTRMAGMSYAPQYSIPDVRTDSFGLYSEYAKKLTERLNLTFGGRLDTVTTAADSSKANTALYNAYNSTQITSATNNYPSGNLRMGYKFGFGLEISGGVGHTVRVPDARERYFALKRSGTDWVGNPLLKPSRNTGVDASLSFRHEGLLLESNLYLNSINDYVSVIPQNKINPTAGVMNSRARSYQNVDARIAGGEFLVSYVLHRNVFVSSDLSYVRGTRTIVPERGILTKNLAEMTPLRSRTSLRYETIRFFGEIETVFSGAQNDVDSLLGEQRTAGYGIANLKTGLKLRGLSMNLSLGNIFGRTYYENLSYQRDPYRSGARVYEPGRNFFINLSYRY